MRFKTGDPRKDKIWYEISNFRFKDLQGAALIRGLSLEDAVLMDAPTMSNWVFLHWDDRKDKKRLITFDKWVDRKLKEKGLKKSNPIRQYKKFSDQYDNPEEEKPKEIKPPKVKKEKRQKNEYGIFVGTKKEYVYKLSQSIYDQFGKKYKFQVKVLIKRFSNQLFSKVKEKFTEANEKSIRIWMSRFLVSYNDALNSKKGKT